MVWRPAPRDEVASELAFHREMLARDLLARGLTLEAVERELERRDAAMSGLTPRLEAEAIRRNTREERRLTMDELLQDLRFALRTLRRNPGFTIAAILTIGLGVGANATVFSVLNGVVLAPLSFPEHERLVQIGQGHSRLGSGIGAMSPPNYLDLRGGVPGLVSAGAYYDAVAAVQTNSETRRVPSFAVTPSLLATLGVSPLLGRSFTEEDAAPGGGKVVLLSHGLWRDLTGADPAVVGTSLRIDGQAWTVIGVMPPEFQETVGAGSLWVPLGFGPDIDGQRGAQYLGVIGRLAPGATLDGVRAELTTLAARLTADYPRPNEGLLLLGAPLQEFLVGDVRTSLIVLTAAVGLVVLIACANVANLLLVRGASRAGELSLRSALGAGQHRILRQILTETLVLFVLGGGAALFLAYGGVGLLQRVAPTSLPRLDQVTIDLPVLAFVTGIVLLGGLVVGLVPALRAARLDPAAGVRAGVRTVVGRRGVTRRLLVTIEVALAVVLLAGSLLLTQSLAGLLRRDPGFAMHAGTVFDLAALDPRYEETSVLVDLTDRVTDALTALPGVSAVGAIHMRPFTLSGFGGTFVTEALPEQPGDNRRAQVRVVTPGYFAALGVPLLEGRGLETTDRHTAPRVMLVNATAAERYWPNGDALGQRVRIHVSPGTERLSQDFTTIVGIVGDVRSRGLDLNPVPEFYVPQAQAGVATLTYVLRTSGDPTALAAPIRAAVRQIDPGVAVDAFTTLPGLLGQSLVRHRFYALLFGCFAVLALVLAAVGVYGVIAHGVRLRTREIGVRMALGADRRRVLRGLLRDELPPALAGVALGLLGAVAAAPLLKSFLVGVSAQNPVAPLVGGVVLTGVAVIAALIPSRRAAATDPAVILRGD